LRRTKWKPNRTKTKQKQNKMSKTKTKKTWKWNQKCNLSYIWVVRYMSGIIYEIIGATLRKRKKKVSWSDCDLSEKERERVAVREAWLKEKKSEVDIHPSIVVRTCAWAASTCLTVFFLRPACLYACRLDACLLSNCALCSTRQHSIQCKHPISTVDPQTTHCATFERKGERRKRQSKGEDYPHPPSDRKPVAISESGSQCAQPPQYHVSAREVSPGKILGSTATSTGQPRRGVVRCIAA
jgi:hypothetical protein